MTTVEDVVFSVVWTWSYPDLLSPPASSPSPPPGRLVNRGGYTSAVNNIGSAQSHFEWPWQSSGAVVHWNRFWMYYLAAPERLRSLSPDAAWERVVPLSVPGGPYSGPAGTTVELNALLFPAAVVVVASVHAHGSWPVTELARAMSGLRASKAYGCGGAQPSANRNLDGLALDLREAVVPHLSSGPPVGEPAYPSRVSVTAVLAGSGGPAEFALDAPGVKECLAGLSALGPPGPIVESHLLAASTDTNLGGRVYQTGAGHVIWSPEDIANRPDNDPIGCLHSNHVYGVAQVEGLAGLVQWAATMVTAFSPIPSEVQPLIELVLRALYRLYEGDRDRTYRSEVLKGRVERLKANMDKVSSATGFESG